MLGMMSLVAVAVVVYSLYISLSHVINSTQRELQGRALLPAVSKTIQMLQQHRGLTLSMRGGSLTLQSQQGNKQTEIDASLVAMGLQLPAEVLDKMDFQRLIGDWQRLKTEGSTWPITVNFDEHTRLIDELMMVMVSIADDYGLILDPGIGSYYLIDTTVNKLPIAIERMGQIRAFGSGVLADKQIDEDKKHKIITLMAGLEDALKYLSRHLDKTARYNPGMEVTLSEANREINDAVRHIVALVSKDILTEQFATTPEQFFALTTQEIDKIYQLINDTLYLTTDALLQASIERSQSLLWQSIGVAVLLFVLVFYFSMGIYYVTHDNIQSLDQAARAFAVGDLSRRVHLDTRDELRKVGDSFNQMADGFAQLYDEQRSYAERLNTLSIAIEQSPVAVVITDRTGNIQYVNPHFSRISGYSFDEALGKNPRILKAGLTPPETYSELWATILRGEVWNDTLINRRKDGSVYYESAHIAPVIGDDGVITHFVAVKQDVSEQLQLQQQVKSRAQVLEMLAGSAQLSTILDAVVEGMEKCLPGMRCSVLLLDDRNQYLTTVSAPSLPTFYNKAVNGLKIGQGVGSCGTAAFTGQRVVVADTQTHPYWQDYRELAMQAEIVACWSQPIRLRDGNVLGTLAIYPDRCGKPGDKEIELMEFAANLAGIAIQRHQDDEAQKLAALVFETSSEAMLVTEADGRIIATNPAFTDTTGYTAMEVLGKNPKILSSGKQDAEFYQKMWNALNGTGHWRGEIWNRRKNGELYPEELTINTIFNADGSQHRRVAMFCDISEKKATEEQIWQQANFDPLTGLSNRRRFHENLSQEMRKCHRNGNSLGLMFLDLDRFKEINDSLGHEMGDLLLQEAAKRLKSCVRDTDNVARLGGDEFTIILSELDNTEHADRIAQAVLKSMTKPFALGMDMAYVSASIGITFYPNDAEEIEQLLKNADQAMYAAKHQGRNGYRYFTPAMQEATLNRVRLTNDLRQALELQQFQLYYQPIVELASGSIHKAEALIRWQHPDKGLVSPATFIPLAEESGLIVDIGDWVFRTATRQVAKWRDQYHPQFQVSINKSPLQFNNVYNGHADWLAYLQDLQLPGQSVVVEITEGLLLDANSRIAERLLAFRDTGIQVAIDDFGTGYSALSYLKKFDIDYIKIDQSFTKGLAPDSDDLALCEAIIVMAHRLGLQVIAEGVETEQQHDLLLAAGCDYGQGYWFAKPLPSEEINSLLGNRFS